MTCLYLEHNYVLIQSVRSFVGVGWRRGKTDKHNFSVGGGLGCEFEIFKFKGGTKDFFEAATTTDGDVLTVRLVIV